MHAQTTAPYVAHLLQEGEPCIRYRLALAGLGGDAAALRRPAWLYRLANSV